jgi:hypothetical protein
MIKGVIHKKYHTFIYNNNNETNEITKYFVNNKLHREDDQPAHVEITHNRYQHSLAIMPYNKSLTVYYKNGLIHRDNDKPAYIENEVTKKWYINGLLHRDNDKPAHTHFLSEYWYINGLLHRDNDKPAYVENVSESYSSIGTFIKKWYINGGLHRVNKPAIIYPYGYGEAFYHNNQLHSYDGKNSSNFINKKFKPFTNAMLIFNRYQLTRYINDKTYKRKIYVDSNRRIYTWHKNGKQISEQESILLKKISDF